MKLSDVNWKHLIAGVLIAVVAFLTGQNGGVASVLQTVGNSIASVVGTSDTSTDG